jgi:large subunit ribosomal protein L22
VISKVTVDQASTLKRWRPRAQGRGTRVEKKSSHITLEVSVSAPAAAKA